MKEELEKQLVEKYPNLYSHYRGDPTKTCMAWGFECGDGWYKLLDELSSKLEPHGIIASQVKEKFGELRFYIDGATEENHEQIYEWINEAEEKSLNTCEVCGNEDTVKPRGSGFVQSLCDVCFGRKG